MSGSSSYRKVLNVIHTINFAQDELDRAAMLSCFIPDRTIRVDVSSHMGIPPMDLTPSQYWEMAYPRLAGFSGTSHTFADPIVTFSGSPHGPDSEEGATHAHFKGAYTSFHVIEEDGKIDRQMTEMTLLFDLEMWKGEWKVTKVVYQRTLPTERAEEFHKRALERVKTGLRREEKR